jgi:hypothetical protein
MHVVSGYGSTRGLLQARRGGVFSQDLAPWITSFFSMSLALNIICTSEIHRNIWFLPANAESYQRRYCVPHPGDRNGAAQHPQKQPYLFRVGKNLHWQWLVAYLSDLPSIQIIFLESAATYSTSLLVLLIFYVLNSNAQYILLDVVGHSSIMKDYHPNHTARQRR